VKEETLKGLSTDDAKRRKQSGRQRESNVPGEMIIRKGKERRVHQLRKDKQEGRKVRPHRIFNHLREKGGEETICRGENTLKRKRRGNGTASNKEQGTVSPGDRPMLWKSGKIWEGIRASDQAPNTGERKVGTAKRKSKPVSQGD